MELNSIDALVTRLCSISSSVLRFVESSGYLVNIDEDDIDEKTFASLLFTNFIDDAFEYGIEFHCTIDELVANEEMMKIVVSFGEFFMPTNLYNSFRLYPEFKEAIRHVLQGNISDESVITQLLDYVADNNESLSEKYTPIRDSLTNFVVSTNTYNVCLENLLKMDDPLADLPPLEPIVLQKYMTYLNDIHTKMVAGIEVLLSAGKDNDVRAVVAKILNRNMLRMANPEYLNAYAYIAFYDTEESTPETDAVFQKYTEQLHKEVGFFKEFYLVKPGQFSKASILLMLLYTWVEPQVKGRPLSRETYTAMFPDLVKFFIDSGLDPRLEMQSVIPVIISKISERLPA